MDHAASTTGTPTRNGRRNTVFLTCRHSSQPRIAEIIGKTTVARKVTADGARRPHSPAITKTPKQMTNPRESYHPHPGHVALNGRRQTQTRQHGGPIKWSPPTPADRMTHQRNRPRTRSSLAFPILTAHLICDEPGAISAPRPRRTAMPGNTPKGSATYFNDLPEWYVHMRRQPHAGDVRPPGGAWPRKHIREGLRQTAGTTHRLHDAGYQSQPRALEEQRELGRVNPNTKFGCLVDLIEEHAHRTYPLRPADSRGRPPAEDAGNQRQGPGERIRPHMAPPRRSPRVAERLRPDRPRPDR